MSAHTHTRHRACEETDERLLGWCFSAEKAVCTRTVYRPGSEAADAFTECTDDERDTGRLFSHTRKTCSGAPQWQRAIGVGNVRHATDERWKHQVRQEAQLLLLEYSHYSEYSWSGTHQVRQVAQLLLLLQFLHNGAASSAALTV